MYYVGMFAHLRAANDWKLLYKQYQINETEQMSK